MVYKTHSFSISAAHRLWNPHLSVERNKLFFGKCCNTHGHNYCIEITLRGLVNDETGLVISEKVFDDTVWQILSQFDCEGEINELPIFNQHIATTENFCIRLWELLSNLLTEAAHKDEGAGRDVNLFQITIRETDRNIFTYFGA